jgi:hypothetical protein
MTTTPRLTSHHVGTIYGRTFDYVPRLVEANLDYLVRDVEQVATLSIATLWKRSRWWTGGLVIDQGREGACVGFGVTGEAMASPVRQKFFDPIVGMPTVDRANTEALRVYHRAQEIDEWEGVNYEGTSVRAGMLVGRERGWWDGFRWAKNLDDLRFALELGPVVIGVTWRDGMYVVESDGDVRVIGGVVGGHCLLITGYSPDYAHRGPRFRWRNSWGPGYGLHGNGYIRPEDLDAVLFRDGNEAAVPIGRHLVTNDG